MRFLLAPFRKLAELAVVIWTFTFGWKSDDQDR